MFALRNLKKIRIVVSLFFFVSLSVLFLDPTQSIPVSVMGFFTSLQLLPVITRTIVYIGASTFGLLFLLALTLLFGRVYCSTLCPLGTLQDIVIHLEKKFHKRKRFAYIPPPFHFHYGLFGVMVLLFLIGSIAFLNLFEPFSNYGRILTNLFEPGVILANNILADFFEYFQIFFFYHISYREISFSFLSLPVLFLGIITYMSYKHGRLFCNSLCPAGALLSIFSRVSLFRIVFDEDSCNGCGACERVCKARCIKSEEKRVEYGACINCFNCIKSCPTEGVTYRAVWQKTKKTTIDVNTARRTFLQDASTSVAGFALPAVMRNTTANSTTNNYFIDKMHPVSPPGSEGVDHFSRLCTACHLCVSACPSQVLAPSLFDYGIAGLFQPKMNYNASYCNYDCTICSQVCPSGAILPVDAGTKKRIQIGKVNFFRDDCVVVTKKKACAACSEHCPTKAVHTVPYEGKLLIPEVNNEICVGCGACEHACPTTPRKAIYVSSNYRHLEAKKPEVKQQQPIFDPNSDFPF